MPGSAEMTAPAGRGLSLEGGGVGPLMDLHAHAVAEGCGRSTAIAGGVDDIPGGLSTSRPETPARAASMPARWAFSNRVIDRRISSVTAPTATVRVMSEQ